MPQFEQRPHQPHDVEVRGWLQGYNGGPLRHPTARVYSRDMVTLRRGLEASGLTPTADPDEAFFVGRNPD